MRLFHRTAATAAFLCIFSLFTLAQAVPAQAKEDFQAYWDNGIRLKSDNVSVKIGGRIQFDTMWGAGNRDFERNLNAAGPFIDGFEFRRVRLYSAGEINKAVGWEVHLDFAGGKVAIKNAYVRVLDVFEGTSITFGNQKEPMMLEEMASANYITFMERAFTSAFYPGYSTGIQIANDSIFEGRVSAAAGVFRPGEGEGAVKGPGGSEDGEYDFALRLTFAPLLEEKGEQLIHLGASYRFHEDPSCGGGGSTLDPAITTFPTMPSGLNTARECRYRARPGTHATSKQYVNTKDFDASNIQTFGFELAAQVGIVSVQGEYVLARVSNDYPLLGPNGTGQPTFHAWYVQAGVFATGEFRPYKGGKFNRVKPESELGNSGFGALEIAFRVDSINLTDRKEGIAGGNETNYALGINWYMTANTRIMVNGTLATFDQLVAPGLKEGTLKTVAARFQADF